MQREPYIVSPKDQFLDLPDRLYFGAVFAPAQHPSLPRCVVWFRGKWRHVLRVTVPPEDPKILGIPRRFKGSFLVTFSGLKRPRLINRGVRFFHAYKEDHVLDLMRRNRFFFQKDGPSSSYLMRYGYGTHLRYSSYPFQRRQFKVSAWD